MEDCKHWYEYLCNEYYKKVPTDPNSMVYTVYEVYFCRKCLDRKRIVKISEEGYPDMPPEWFDNRNYFWEED